MGIVSTTAAYAPEVPYWAPMSRFGFNRLLYLFYRVMISRENSSWADSSSFIYDRNTYQQNANKVLKM